MSKPKTPAKWHLLLGRLLYLTLEPLGVQVLTDLQLLSEAPKADILLLQRPGSHWTEEQRRWLADGLRHADEGHLLIEFKYSEGLTLRSLQQLVAYDYFYCGDTGLPASADVACFLVVASTPQGDWQSRLGGFTATAWPGVYQGTETLFKRVQILLLNELEPTPHNAPLKCFATRRQQQIKAFAAVRDSGFINISRHIGQLVDGLWRIFMAEALYTEDLTPEKVMAMGREWIDAILDATPPEEYLNRHKPDEILSHTNLTKF